MLPLAILFVLGGFVIWLCIISVFSAFHISVNVFNLEKFFVDVFVLDFCVCF